MDRTSIKSGLLLVPDGISMPGARILHPGRRVDVSDSQFRSVYTLDSLIHPRLREDAAFVTACLPLILEQPFVMRTFRVAPLRPHRLGLKVA